MSHRAPNYLWRKRATQEWLRENEARLESATGGTHSIVERPGARQLQIEMFCETATRARRAEGGIWRRNRGTAAPIGMRDSSPRRG